MKMSKLLLIFGMMFLFSQCDNYYMICSLNPFYIEKNIILNDRIEGSWTVKAVQPKNNSNSSSEWNHLDTTSTWTITRYISKEIVKNKQGKDSITFKPHNYYHAKLTSSSDSAEYEFKVILFKVKDAIYADFIPANKEKLMKNQLSASGYFEVHTLGRLFLKDKEIAISWLGSDCMKEMIEKKRVRVDYQWVNEANKFILSASSGDLTGMIERYAHETRFIDWENQKSQLKLTSLR